jgi:hypothetical protein
MTDKELLALAAKAAGMKVLRDPNGVLRDCTGMHPSMNIFAGEVWHPLTDDGDALRLAVLLGMNINVVASGVFVSRYESEPVIAEKSDQDIYAATRRAIVRAAAEIGKAMK